MKHFITIGCWLVEVLLLATIFVSIGYTYPQAVLLGSMFLPVLLAMKYFMAQIRQEERRIPINFGVVCLFASYLCLEYLLIMVCHYWMMDYYSEMPSVLLNPVFLMLVLAVLFVSDTYVGGWLSDKYGRKPRTITFVSDRRSVCLRLDSIVYVESNDTEVWIHASDGQSYRNKTPISQWEQLLDEGFIRTHRAFIVNQKLITEIGSEAIGLGEIKVPVSRKYKARVSSCGSGI